MSDIDIDLELEFYNLKNDLWKMIFTIKQKYINDTGEFNIPETDLIIITTLNNTINMLNLLYSCLKENTYRHRKDKIDHVKDSILIKKLKQEIKILNKQVDFS